MKKMTKICKYCKTEIPIGAKVCPQCRRNLGGHGCLVAVGAVVVIGALIIAVSGGRSSSDKTESETETAATASDDALTEAATDVAASAEEETTENEITATEAAEAVKSAVMGLWDDSGEDTDVPTEYRSALKKSKIYVDTLHMSKARLYDQLTSEYGEKFTAEEAQYAIDNITADWNENALATAKNYQTTMPMSPEAIRNQLTSDYGEKFTAEEAEYAISHLD